MINDKGYTFLDIRTGKEYRSGNGLHWCVPDERSAALTGAEPALAGHRVFVRPRDGRAVHV